MNITQAPARDTFASQANRARYAAPARVATVAPVTVTHSVETAAYLNATHTAQARTLWAASPRMAMDAIAAITPPARPGHLRGL